LTYAAGKVSFSDDDALNDPFMSIFWVSNGMNKDETKCLTTRSR
jgi:hypothetical protein